MAWTATITALALLILIIAFIVQNQDTARVRFFGLDGTISLGIALLIAAVGDGALVAAPAAHQLRVGRGSRGNAISLTRG